MKHGRKSLERKIRAIQNDINALVNMAVADAYTRKETLPSGWKRYILFVSMDTNTTRKSAEITRDISETLQIINAYSSELLGLTKDYFIRSAPVSSYAENSDTENPNRGFKYWRLVTDYKVISPELGDIMEYIDEYIDDVIRAGKIWELECFAAHILDMQE